MEKEYSVTVSDTLWAYIVGPNGYREGPYRYQWEAEEFAEKLNSGDLRPESRAVD